MNGKMTIKAIDQVSESRELLDAVINSSLDRIHVMEAVRNEKNDIIDFRWILMNDAAKKTNGDRTGHLLCSYYPGVTQEVIFAAYKKVVETGAALQFDMHYNHEGSDVLVEQSIVKLRDGVVNTAKDITESKKAEQEISDGRTLLQSISDVSLTSISCCRAIRDEHERIVDFEYIFQNNANRNNHEGQNFIGKRASAINPALLSAEVFERFAKTIETGEPQDFEYCHQHNGRDAWYRVVTVRLNDGVMTATEDITARKKTEENTLRLKDDVAQKVTNKYLTLFNNMMQAFCIIEVLFDGDDNANDYRFLEINPVFEKQTGLQDAVGKTMKQLQPAHEEHWFHVYGEVAKSGTAVHFEHEAAYLAGGVWYEVFALPYDEAGKNQVAVFFNDITERKRAEDRQAFLLKLNDTLRPLTSPLEIQIAVADLLGAQLKVSQAHYAETIGEYVYISHTYSDGVPPMIEKVRPIDFGQRMVEGFRRGAIRVCNNTMMDATISEAERIMLASASVRAYIAVPLIKDNEWVATLAVHSKEPRSWKHTEIGLMQEVAERTWVAVEKAKAEDRLAKELEDTRELQQVSTRIVDENDIEVLYEAFLESAMDIMHSDAASLQILLPEKNELQLLTHKGFHPDSEKAWDSTDRDFAGPTGALTNGARVICFDMSDADLAVSNKDREAYHLSGIVAWQSTPLMSRSGRLLGVISTHWKEARYPMDRELHLLDVLARQTADVIEQRQAQETMRINDIRTRKQKEAFQAAVKGAPLKESLNILASIVIEETRGEARAAFYITDKDGTCLHPIIGAGNMPEAYLREVDGFAIGEDSIGCGLAIPTGKPVITADVHEDAAWVPWTPIADRYNFRGSWSFPIKTKDNKAVGTFGMYFGSPKEARPTDLALAEIVTQGAAVIMSNYIDARQRDRAEKALRESEEQLKQLLRQKDEFIGIASHELKTPVTSIKAYAEIVQERLEEMANEDNVKLLSRLNNQIDRLTALINLLLDTTRISEGKLELNRDPVSISELLRERVEEIRQTTDHRFELELEDLPDVLADRERIGQVIINLLSNAIKYSPKGTTISVLAQNKTGGVQVSVCDEGAGIAEEDMPKVFDRFFRVTRNNMNTFPGMGLGLYISAQIIERHGGSMAVRSKDGEGSVFSFFIPN